MDLWETSFDAVLGWGLASEIPVPAWAKTLEGPQRAKIMMGASQGLKGLPLCALRLRAAKQVGFQTGGFPDLDWSFLFCPFLSFSGTFPFSLEFSRFVRGLSGDFPFSWPIDST